ncbi:MAG: efflux RND transporter periplasmic adaptor subunit [Gammaproteobacteria bacterium]|jgi:RND family efflux transporter MFP subunit
MSRADNKLQCRSRSALALGLALLTATACSEKGPAAPKAAWRPEVTVAEVRRETIPILMEFPGTVTSVRAVKIIARVSGQLVERKFTEGTYVDEGDLLYVIDPRPLQAQLAAATAQLAQDEASLKLWHAEAKRYDRLAARGAVSTEDKAKADAQLDEARAAVTKDRANIESAKLSLEYAHVTAPFHGYIQDTLVHEGSQVIEEQTVMTTLVQTNPIHVMFSISRSQLAAIQRLQSQGFAPERLTGLAVSARLGDGSSFQQLGHLDFISAEVDPDTDTLQARAELPNPSGPRDYRALISGQYVPIVLTVGHHPDALLIPRASLLETQDGRFVYLVGKDNKVEKRKIEIGSGYQGDRVVHEGLKEGERVIVSGLQKVRSGAEVKPLLLSTSPKSGKNTH